MRTCRAGIRGTAPRIQGNPVDVSGTGVDRADFLQRPAFDITEPEHMLVNMLKESGILDEEHNLRELEEALGRRMRGEPAPPTQESAIGSGDLQESGTPLDRDRPDSDGQVTSQAPESILTQPRLTQDQVDQQLPGSVDRGSQGTVPLSASHPVDQALAERPEMEIPDSAGVPVKAADVLEQADDAVAQATEEAPTATSAAVNCFLRRGG